jgi:Fic-DOC domain mobile mystery protein B
VTDPLVPVGDGHTLLDDEATEGLKPAWIRTRDDLNGAEQENILKAVVNRRQPTAEDLLTDRYLRSLHKAMFGDVWVWAGTYRKSNPNIGCEWQQIAVNIGSLLGDTNYWIQEATYPADEIAVRFHHRLVWIHAFPNGNGRHTRLVASYLAIALGAGPLTWGAGLDLATDDLRKRYISALLLADRENDLSRLIAFARS